MDTLNSASHDLRTLAQNSGYEVLSFYQGADLVGLKLDGQDLRGLNFDNADVRFSSLQGCRFDQGAFNRAEISDDLLWAIDHYDLAGLDILNHPAERIFIFVQFRVGEIDNLLSLLHIPYSNFSVMAKVGENALRKARNGVTVAFSTAKSIIAGMHLLVNEFDKDLGTRGNSSLVRGFLAQPMAVFMSGGINGVFKPLARRKIHELLGYKMYVDSLRATQWVGHSPYRETPESIESAKTYFGDLPKDAYDVRTFAVN